MNHVTSYTRKKITHERWFRSFWTWHEVTGTRRAVSNFFGNCHMAVWGFTENCPKRQNIQQETVPWVSWSCQRCQNALSIPSARYAEEHLWLHNMSNIEADYLKQQKTTEDSPVTSKWTKISKEWFQHLLESMAWKIKTVLKAKGGPSWCT